MGEMIFNNASQNINLNKLINLLTAAKNNEGIFYKLFRLPKNFQIF